MTEQKLWQGGLRSWQEARACQDSRQFCGAEAMIRYYLELSEQALATGDLEFFADRLSSGDLWRLYPSLAGSARIAYLDIETTGMMGGYHSLTVVGIYDGSEYKYFVQGGNLDDLPAELAQYDVVVTFNGKTFDIPFLRAAWPGMTVPPIHIDLRYVLRQLKLTGGLKKIERKLAIAREQDELWQLDGFDAVTLWQLHKRGDRRALTTLLRYNAEDVVGLKPLLEYACNQLIATLPLDIRPLTITERMIPDIPYSKELIRQIKGNGDW